MIFEGLTYGPCRVCGGVLPELVQIGYGRGGFPACWWCARCAGVLELEAVPMVPRAAASRRPGFIYRRRPELEQWGRREALEALGDELGDELERAARSVREGGAR